MSFAETLNTYMDAYGIKATDLAEMSGLSSATISRFKNGKREPSIDDGSCAKIAAAIEVLSNGSVSKDEVYENLSITVEDGHIDLDHAIKNLNILIDTLEIKAASLARALGYDPSHLSKIRSGARKPGKSYEFCEGVAAYVTSQVTERNIATLAHIIGCDVEGITAPAACKDAILDWLTSGTGNKDNAVEHFLMQLDEFDLNEYLKAVSFDAIKVPSVPFQLPKNRDFFTIEGFREAELAWGRATVTSKHTEDVFMYSDMPIEEEAQDEEFAKQWMMGIAMILKKGLRINIIHDLNRPLHEMMLGLEGWIPLYMTGQVAPYYLKGYKPGVFNHFLRTSGAAALTGESIAGAHAHGKYHLTNNKEELAYAKQYAADLLAAATPLMEIYPANKQEAFERCLARMSEDGSSIQELELGQGAFNNMTLESIEGKCLIITKTNEPVMRFVIRHPKLMHAIENLTVPITE